MTTAESIRRSLSTLFEEGTVVELRALGERTWYGYYTDHDKLARDAAVLDGTPGISGIYTTLNSVNPALLSRCANRMKKAGQKEPQTTDGDITWRCWLPIDIDPVRPSGVSSSETEHAWALQKAATVQTFLTELGWPDPIVGDSGNGAHLLYRIDLPADPESHILIRTCIDALDRFFSDEQSKIDTTVYNPGRIWKLYGTRSRKGDHTADRPHRESQICEIPDSITAVPASSLEVLASRYELPTKRKPEHHPRNGEHGLIDLAEWLSKQGISYTEKPYHAGRLFLFDECPFSTAHKDGAYAIQFANGALFAGCHHDSCGGGRQRWQDLKERFEPVQVKKTDYDERTRQWSRDRVRAKARRDGLIPEQNPKTDQIPDQQENTPITEDPEILAEAKRILEEGDPIAYFLDTFSRSHEGDRIVAQCLLLSLSSRSVINSKGLHVLVTGESGKGKSHAFETMLDLIPQEYRLSGGLSNKALYYTSDLRKGSVICLDDVSLSMQMQETLKGVTTSFREPFVYRTVDKDRNSITRVIPERCLWWIAKVEGTGDDQIWNRMLTVWIDDSQKQDDLVLARELAAAARFSTEPKSIPRDIRICRAIWQKNISLSVVIPYAERIRFSNSGNRRNSSMLLDLIRSVATLYQFQRERRTISGTTEIIATEEDFRKAKEVYLKLSGESGGQMTKLTSTEYLLVQAIRKSGKITFSIKEMQKMINRSQSTISRLLNGNPERGHYVGLLEKCPPLSCYDRSEKTDDGGYKRGRVYTWDHEMDEYWSSGAVCWLDESGNDNSEDPDGKQGSEIHSSTSMQGRFTDGCIESEDKGFSDSDKANEYRKPDSEFHDQKSRTAGSEEVAPGIVNEICASIPENEEHTEINQKNIDNSGRIFMHNQGDTLCKDVQFMHKSEKAGTQSNIKEPHPSPAAIDPASFYLIETRKDLVCDSCRNKGVEYREKKSAVKPGNKCRLICKHCYSTAVSREVLSIRAIPGVLPTRNMIKTDRNLGRCHLCNLHPVTRFDNESKIGLCEKCFHREKWNTPADPNGGRT